MSRGVSSSGCASTWANRPARAAEREGVIASPGAAASAASGDLSFAPPVQAIIGLAPDAERRLASGAGLGIDAGQRAVSLNVDVDCPRLDDVPQAKTGSRGRNETIPLPPGYPQSSLLRNQLCQRRSPGSCFRPTPLLYSAFSPWSCSSRSW